MSAALVAAGVALAAISGVPGLLLRRRDDGAGERIAASLLAVAALCTIAGVAQALLRPGAGAGVSFPSPFAGAEFRLAVDALSAIFLLPIVLIPLTGAIYGLRYWSQLEHPQNGRTLRLFYGLLTAAMAVVVTARNAPTFLVAWEVMALAAFVLITTEDADADVRAAGYLYLVCTRIGTLCLFAMFGVMFAVHGSWDFDRPFDGNSAAGTAIFLLGFVGFALKAGVVPFHVWLPPAHANAPSHVSAVLSGVLLKIGIYGLVRITALASPLPLWWGELLLGFGVVSGVFGVAFAIGQHDLKRLLAYHSVENIGIICIGLGLAVIARATGRTELLVLGLAGALLHVWNHGLFKSLLFLAAGSVLHASGTREIDHLGGLAKSMPKTASAFLVGAIAICGLPPLNGFISELLIYLGLFRGAAAGPRALWLAVALAAAALALIGALAVACFVKVFGAVFLGEPRSPAAFAAHESPTQMTAPMLALAGACAAIGLGSPLVAPVLDRAVFAWAPEIGFTPLLALAPLSAVTSACAVLLVLAVLTGAWLQARTRQTARSGTWDCGYAEPTARMQYTASSFADSLVSMCRTVLRPRVDRAVVSGPFPSEASFRSDVPDVVLEDALLPAARLTERGFVWFRWLQRGSLNAYLVYILATLVWLFVWQGGR
jgi:hydrogenase-4 component B